jgi:hypothetical protein
MTTLGICLWLIASVITYYIEEVAVRCCDPTQWNHTNKIVVAIWALILGPFALIIALQVLLLAEMAEGVAHRRPLVFKHQQPPLVGK